MAFRYNTHAAALRGNLAARRERSMSQPQAVLIAINGPLKARRWTVDRPLLIGRDPERCDVVIPERQVSRCHARLTPYEHGVLLEDLGSKNGTFVNGEAVEQHWLQDGDIISIALAQRLAFWRSEATLTLPLDEGPTPTAAAGLRLSLDPATRQVWVRGREIQPPLSASQFRLLEALYRRLGEVVPRETLIAAVWGPQASPAVSNQALDALIHRLRERLAEADPEFQYLHTVRGQGLRLENAPWPPAERST